MLKSYVTLVRDRKSLENEIGAGTEPQFLPYPILAVHRGWAYCYSIQTSGILDRHPIHNSLSIFDSQLM
jgi:hypothetical protein